MLHNGPPMPIMLQAIIPVYQRHNLRPAKGVRVWKRQFQGLSRHRSGRALVCAKDSRSAVTNGKRLFVVPPGDNVWSRRFRDVLFEIVADLELANPDGLTEAQRQLARRAATICITCEKMEGEAAAGADIDLDLYGRLTDRLNRTFFRLGVRKHKAETGAGLSALIIEQDREDQARRTAAAPEREEVVCDD
jgi:hypothetical protein